MNPRRKLVNGQWYVASSQGGWKLESTPQPSQPQPQPQPQPVETVQTEPVVTAVPETPVDPSPDSPKKNRKKKTILWVISAAVVLLLLCIGASFVWYQQALKPVSQDETAVRVTVKPGSSPAVIAQLLHENELIRSTLAFDIYTRLTSNRANLQLGTYMLSPSFSTSEIVSHLTSGKVDVFPVTIYSGESLAPPLRSTATDGKDFTSVLTRAGFTSDQIADALNATYTSPLFQGRPSGASLEGYIFPDTYSVDTSMTAQQFIQQTIRKYEQVVADNDLTAKFKARGLTLYEGITLASIIEKEMGRFTADMPQVAQVFYTRLADDMQLGSDVTAYYGADLQGLPRAVATDTPYNTRMHTGMPPGPIGMPSEAALKAAANPAKGDYVFFLSGDDGKNYFAHTDAEHQRNIVNHCKIGCSIP